VSADDVTTRAVHAIAAQKTRLTVFSSIHGAVLVNEFPPGEKLNGRHFCQQMVDPLYEILHSERATGLPRVIVPFGNAALHRSPGTENCFHSCEFPHRPQPSYHPDINPCDIFLFGDLKAELRGEQLDTMEELQRRVEEVLGRVTSDTMRRVYERWIQKLNQAISADGNYV
jgi:hypothetical protein